MLFLHVEWQTRWVPDTRSKPDGYVYKFLPTGTGMGTNFYLYPLCCLVGNFSTRPIAIPSGTRGGGGGVGRGVLALGCRGLGIGGRWWCWGPGGITTAGGGSGASCNDFLNGSCGDVHSTARVVACERGNMRRMKSGREEENRVRAVSKSTYVHRLPCHRWT
jgi:hypothetical protein